MRMTYEDFIKLWFVATEIEDIGSKYYKKHAGVLEELKDFSKWFFTYYIGLDSKTMKELGLNEFSFAIRIIASSSAVGLLMCKKKVDIESLVDALNYGEGLNFKYAYNKYCDWYEGENVKIETITINAKKMKGDDILLASVEKKRRRGKANIKKLEDLQLGDIDVLLGEFFFDFKCENGQLKNPKNLLNKITKELHEEFGFDYKDLACFDVVLEMLSGSVAKKKYISVLDVLDNEELIELCLWLDVYYKNKRVVNYYEKSITFGFEPNKANAATKYKLYDILVTTRCDMSTQIHTQNITF